MIFFPTRAQIALDAVSKHLFMLAAQARLEPVEPTCGRLCHSRIAGSLGGGMGPLDVRLVRAGRTTAPTGPGWRRRILHDAGAARAEMLRLLRHRTLANALRAALRSALQTSVHRLSDADLARLAGHHLAAGRLQLWLRAPVIHPISPPVQSAQDPAAPSESAAAPASTDLSSEMKASQDLSAPKHGNPATTASIAKATAAPIEPAPPSLADRLAAEDKATRHAARRDLIAQTRDRGGPPQALDAADRFERDIDAVEKAKLSQNVYDPNNGPPEGWKNLSDNEAALAALGLTPKDLEPEGTKFRAQVYQPSPAIFGANSKPVIAFKGTSGGQDWKNNFRQGINLESSYYEQAVKMGTKVTKRGLEIEITGHSLGGGLASAMSLASGRSATTFNPAGLHPRTVERYGGNVHPARIRAYRIKGEVLTHLQEDRVTTRWAMPDAAGTPVEIQSRWWERLVLPQRVGLHMIGPVIKRLEKQKEVDQGKLLEVFG
ncbi:MAG: hypothetical protein ACFB22_07220 [Rhodothalassiaceae bacterium]